jgi:hypothetical protein
MLVTVLVTVLVAFTPLVANFHKEFVRGRLLRPRRRVSSASRDAKQRQDENWQNQSLHLGPLCRVPRV